MSNRWVAVVAWLSLILNGATTVSILRRRQREAQQREYVRRLLDPTEAV